MDSEPDLLVALAALTPDSFKYTHERWPGSITGGPYEQYVQVIEGFAGQLLQQGVYAVYVAIDARAYGQWCKRRGCDPRDSTNRAAYGAQMVVQSTDRVIPVELCGDLLAWLNVHWPPGSEWARWQRARG